MCVNKNFGMIFTNLYNMRVKNNYKLNFILCFLYTHDIILIILNEGVMIMKFTVIVTRETTKINRRVTIF